MTKMFVFNGSKYDALIFLQKSHFKANIHNRDDITIEKKYNDVQTTHDHSTHSVKHKKILSTTKVNNANLMCKIYENLLKQYLKM